VNDVEYASVAVLRLIGYKKDGTDRQTDGRTADDNITLTARRGQPNNIVLLVIKVYHVDSPLICYTGFGISQR